MLLHRLPGRFTPLVFALPYTLLVAADMLQHCLPPVTNLSISEGTVNIDALNGTCVRVLCNDRAGHRAAIVRVGSALHRCCQLPVICC